MKPNSNHGHMLTISEYKLAIARGHRPPDMSIQKAQHIANQVQKRQLEIAAVKKYQPFTSGSPKRRPRQVGA